MEISANRYKSLLAAEEVCRALRRDICDHGGMTRATLPLFDRWMRLGGMSVYDHPKHVRPTWCCECKCRHVYDNHVEKK